MKKKKILIVLLCMMLALGMTGCTSTNTIEGYKDYDIHSKLIKIEGEKDLYYYSSTHVMYIVFNEYKRGMKSGYGYMAPYYSKNGKLCTYDTEKKQIVEIDK